MDHSSGLSLAIIPIQYTRRLTATDHGDGDVVVGRANNAGIQLLLHVHRLEHLRRHRIRSTINPLIDPLDTESLRHRGSKQNLNRTARGRDGVIGELSYLCGELLESADVDGTSLGGRGVAPARAQVACRTDHPARKAQRVVAAMNTRIDCVLEEQACGIWRSTHSRLLI